MRFVKFSDQTIEPVEKNIDDLIVSGNPKHMLWSHFLGANDTFKSGMWDSTAGVFHGPMNDQIEFCHILEGEASIEIPGAETFTVRAGDSFVMDNGLQPIWHVKEYVRKHYVICAISL